MHDNIGVQLGVVNDSSYRILKSIGAPSPQIHGSNTILHRKHGASSLIGV